MKREIFRIVGLVGTFEYLKQIEEKERCSYKNLKLITHHFDRGKEKRIEWYEITEKGMKFLSILEQLDQLSSK